MLGCNLSSAAADDKLDFPNRSVGCDVNESVAVDLPTDREIQFVKAGSVDELKLRQQAA